MSRGFDGSLAERFKTLRIRASASDQRYRDTYPLILDFFKANISTTELTENNAKIAVMLVYSWMAPAKLNTTCWAHFAGARRCLFELKAAALTEARLERIKSFVGGSLIATSKFLHFFDPHRFAIWDQHAARAAYGLKSRVEFVNSSVFLRYLEDLEALTLTPETEALIRREIGDCTKMRMKELALFHLGNSEIS